MLNVCCMNTVCNGCIVASYRQGLGGKCPFCRTPGRYNTYYDAVTLPLVQKRADAKDPLAIEFLATAYHNGNYGLREDIPRAFEMRSEAARLGDLDAHCSLGYRYCYGKDVERDVARGIRHWRHAAIQGHPDSRCALGCHEYHGNGNYELAVRHWVISAKMGDKDSLGTIKSMFMKGLHAEGVSERSGRDQEPPARRSQGLLRWK